MTTDFPSYTFTRVSWMPVNSAGHFQRGLGSRTLPRRSARPPWALPNEQKPTCVYLLCSTCNEMLSHPNCVSVTVSQRFCAKGSFPYTAPLPPSCTAHKSRSVCVRKRIRHTQVETKTKGKGSPVWGQGLPTALREEEKLSAVFPP